MLIDLHGDPADLSPSVFAQAAVAAGLDAVVVTDKNRTDRLDDYLDALEDAGVAGYAGIEITLDRGALIFIPRDIEDDFFDETWPQSWTLESAVEFLSKFDGILIGVHPYCRDLCDDHGGVFGDRIFQIKGLTALEVRVGRGKMLWDNMADTAADRMQLLRVGGSGGGKWLGRAATVVKGDIETQPELVEAIEARLCWPIEFEPLDEPRDRTQPSRGSYGERPSRFEDDRPRSTRPERGDRAPASRNGQRARRDGDARPERGYSDRPRRNSSPYNRSHSRSDRPPRREH